MHAAVPTLLLSWLVAGEALAAACQVTAEPSSSAIRAVEKELCYEFTGMDEGAIDWACTDQKGEMIVRRQHPVESCASGSVGRCEAALTQETLSNYRAFDDDQGKPRPAVPNDAKVITHYYRTGDLKQVRIDCESSGGTWQEGE